MLQQALNSGARLGTAGAENLHRISLRLLHLLSGRVAGFFVPSDAENNKDNTKHNVCNQHAVVLGTHSTQSGSTLIVLTPHFLLLCAAHSLTKRTHAVDMLAIRCVSCTSDIL